MADLANSLTCFHAWPGTYGHECGKPATLAGAKRSELTRSGIFWTRRCAECATHASFENAEIPNWEPLDPIAHHNEWK